MTSDDKNWPSYIETIPAQVEHLRQHDAHGSFAAADLLDAAHFILSTLNDRDFNLGKVTNADCLRLLALRLRGE